MRFSGMAFSLRSPWFPFLQRVKNTAHLVEDVFYLHISRFCCSSLPLCVTFVVCPCLQQGTVNMSPFSTSYHYNHWFTKLPVSLDCSLNEGGVPTLLVLDLLFLTLWFAHSRLFMNTCQGNERDNAHGGALKTTGTKQDWGIMGLCSLLPIREKDLASATPNWRVRWSDYCWV